MDFKRWMGGNGGHLDKEIELLTKKHSIKYIDKSIYKIQNEIEKFYRIEKFR